MRICKFDEKSKRYTRLRMNYLLFRNCIQIGKMWISFILVFESIHTKCGYNNVLCRRMKG